MSTNLPRTDCEEIVRQIAADPRLAGTALLLMTPFGERGPEMRSLPYGPVDFVAKPIIASRLRHALTRALGSRAAPETVAAAHRSKPRDAAGARRQAHTVKGAAANLSAGALPEAAFQSEQAARAGELTRVAEKLLPAMEGEFERFKAALV